MVIEAVIKSFRVVLEGKGINIEADSIEVEDIKNFIKWV
jgi:hypothetical protein